MAPDLEDNTAETELAFDNRLLSKQKDGVEIGSVLCCPICGHNYMHQETVSQTSGRGDKKTSIELWCEECNNVDRPYELVLLEHEGNTMIYWNPSTFEQ